MILLTSGIAVAWSLVGGPRSLAVGSSVVAFGIDPLLGIVVVGLWFLGARLRRISAERSAARRRRSEVVLAVELVAVGVSSGVSFDESVRAAAGFVAPDVGASLSRLQRINLSGATAPTEGDPLITMFDRARGSEISGAPLADELRALSRGERERDTTDTEERLARLPVKMLFPLAFLILPGFLLVAVVPSVAGGLARLTL